MPSSTSSSRYLPWLVSDMYTVFAKFVIRCLNLHTSYLLLSDFIMQSLELISGQYSYHSARSSLVSRFFLVQVSAKS